MNLGTARVTLTAVADHAGVSKATASQILNNRALGFSPETCQRVRQAARELHYRPTRSRPASSQRAQTLCFLHHLTFSNQAHRGSYYAQIIDNLQAQARQRGFQLSLATGLATAAEKIAFLREHGRSVDGILLGGVVEDAVLDCLEELSVPAVFVGDSTITHGRFPGVYGDNYQGGRLAAEHLLALGHRRFAFIGYPGRAEFYQQRLCGFRDAVLRGGGTAEQVRIWDLNDAADPPAVVAALTQLLQGPHRPSAAFTAAGDLGPDLLAALGRCGLQAPRDLSVISYDDCPDFDSTQPPLTAVVNSRPVIAALAVETLLRVTADPTIPSATVLTPARIVVRSSTAPPVNQSRERFTSEDES